MENDNWKLRTDGSSQQAEIEATGLRPTNDLEATVLTTLPPGQYTAQVRDKPEATGIGVVQVYFLQEEVANVLRALPRGHACGQHYICVMLHNNF